MESNMTIYPSHKYINVDVKIPGDWSNLSYHNDVCPSFGVHGLQIFVCDQETRDAEGFGEKYTIMIEEYYGEDREPLLSTNDWNKVLEFVNNQGEKNEIRT